MVIERGHHKAKNCERIFEECKKTLEANGEKLLGTFTMAGKEDAEPLMAADYLAHGYMMMRRPGAIGVEGYSKAAHLPKKGKAGLTFLDIHPETLPNLKLQMQQNRLLRRAYARQQKDAAKARASSSDPAISLGE